MDPLGKLVEPKRASEIEAAEIEVAPASYDIQFQVFKWLQMHQFRFVSFRFKAIFTIYYSEKEKTIFCNYQ